MFCQSFILKGFSILRHLLVALFFFCLSSRVGEQFDTEVRVIGQVLDEEVGPLRIFNPIDL
jgi:hypothetical protein